MRLCAVLLSVAALVPAIGQSREGGTKEPKDAKDIVGSLVQSQLVDFRPNISRDPFALPSDQAGQSQGLFTIDEITIKGRMVIKKRPFAIILDPMQNARQIPVGFRFLDGVVTAITENAVIFDQWDTNSQSRSERRTVTKYFKREEDKR